MCGIDRVYGAYSDSDEGYEYEEMYCSDDEYSETGDACFEIIEDNGKAHDMCGSDAELCELGEFCYI